MSYLKIVRLTSQIYNWIFFYTKEFKPSGKQHLDNGHFLYIYLYPGFSLPLCANQKNIKNQHLDTSVWRVSQRTKNEQNVLERITLIYYLYIFFPNYWLSTGFESIAWSRRIRNLLNRPCGVQRSWDICTRTFLAHLHQMSFWFN